MEGLYYILTLLAGLAGGGGLVKFIDRLRQRDAQNSAQQILERAERDATSRLREAELEAKERALQEKTKAEAELNKLRDEHRERERSLDKRQETLGQQADDLRKQERMVEGTQRKLTQQLGEANQRNEELGQILEAQRQTLHELSNLSKDEAEKRLLGMVESELSQEIGSMILKHEKNLAEKCDIKAREMLLTSLQRFAAARRYG